MVPIPAAQDEKKGMAALAHSGSRSHLSCSNTERFLRGPGVCQVEERKVGAPGRGNGKDIRCTGKCEDKREDTKIARTLLHTEQLLHKWHLCYCCAEEAEAKLSAWQVPICKGLRKLVCIFRTMKSHSRL